ncbi:MAG: helix-hairpin-helix domain-containing protein, partial [Myxococcota bacterium]
ALEGALTGLRTRVAEMRDPAGDPRIIALEARVHALTERLDGPASPSLEALAARLDALEARVSEAPPAEAPPHAKSTPAEPEPATEPSEAEAPAPPAAASSGALTDVKGIGPKYARALKGAGVPTTEALASLDDEALDEVAAALKAPRKRLAGWRDRARAMVRGA